MEFEGRAPIREQLNIAPLIDVVLLLLVFFMLTSTFYTPEAIDLDLPSSSTAVPREDLPVVVSVAKDGEILVNDSPVALEALVDYLRVRLDGDHPAVTLKTDASVSVQHMLEVMDAVRTAGGRRVAIATEEVRP